MGGGSDGEASGLELFMTGLDELLHARYIDLRSARQLLVSLEKLHEPTKSDVIWQDDATDSGVQWLVTDVLSRDAK